MLHTLARQIAVFNPVRLIGFLAQAPFPIRVVLAVVPFEPDHLAVAFEGHDVGRDPVEKPAIVTADDEIGRSGWARKPISHTAFATAS